MRFYRIARPRGMGGHGGPPYSINQWARHLRGGQTQTAPHQRRSAGSTSAARRSSERIALAGASPGNCIAMIISVI